MYNGRGSPYSRSMSGRQGQATTSSGSHRDPASAASCVPSTGAAAVGRCLRLPTFVAVSTLLAVTAHGAARRMTPDIALTLAVVVVVTAVGLVLCRRRRSFEAIAGGLVVAQVLAHVVLCLDHLGVASPASAHVHAGPAAALAQGVLAQVVPDPAMALAHILAAGVAAWWMSRGEAAIWSTACRWWAVVALPHVRFTDVAARPAPRVTGEQLVLSLHDQLAGPRTRPRRGPPVAARAFA